MFTEEALKKLDLIVKKYPTKKAALLPALWLAQEENDGWVPREAMKEIADYLGLAPADVEGVATFYTMYNKAPIGKYHLEVCHNIVCIDKGETTPDKKFTLNGAECLGACANAPCMMVGNRYYEDLDFEKTDKILDELARS